MLCHGRKLLSPLVNVFEPSNLCCFLLCESSWLSHVKEKSLLSTEETPLVDSGTQGCKIGFGYH